MAVTVNDSILDTIKTMMGPQASVDAFDTELIVHINTVFMYLKQLGLGSDDGFAISDNSATWADFIPEEKLFNAYKDYIYIRVKLIFDPPQSSTAVKAFEDTYREIEWRLTSEKETGVIPNE